MYVLIAVIVLLSAAVIVQIPEFGFVVMILVPLVKDLAMLPAEDSILLNLLLIFTLVTIGSVLLKYFREIRILLLPKIHSILFLLFVAVLSFSLLYTNSFEYGLEKLAKFIFFNGFLFFSGMLVFQNTKRCDVYLKLLESGIIILSVISSGLIIQNILSGNFAKMLIARFTITGGNPIGMARVCGLGVLLGLVSLVENRRKIYIFIALLPMVLSLAASNTRGPVIALFAVVFIYLFFIVNIGWTKKILALLALVLVVICIYVILPENLLNRYMYLFQGNSFSTARSVTQVSSSAQRLIFFQRIFEYFQDYPLSLIWGNGIGNFAKLFEEYQVAYYPHNIFLEILYEQGLIGIVIFSVSVFYILWGAIQVISKKGDKQYFVKIFLAFMYFLINAQVSGDLSDNRYIWFFAGALIGLITAYKEQNTHNSSRMNYDFSLQ